MGRDGFGCFSISLLVWERGWVEILSLELLVMAASCEERDVGLIVNVDDKYGGTLPPP